MHQKQASYRVLVYLYQPSVERQKKCRFLREIMGVDEDFSRTSDSASQEDADPQVRKPKNPNVTQKAQEVTRSYM